jgi:phosphopantothenoylcysteine synthetase/decarboxylase
VTAGHLQIIVCGAGPATDVHELIAAAHARSWTAAVTATASAMPFLDTRKIENLAGNPVRTGYQPSATGRRTLPPVDALIIAPATYNTINKLALGIADTYPLTSAAELIGRGIPTVIVPFVNAALAARAPFNRALIDLRGEGIRVLSGQEDSWAPHPPGTGPDIQVSFPWKNAFLLAEQAADRRMHP